MRFQHWKRKYSVAREVSRFTLNEICVRRLRYRVVTCRLNPSDVSVVPNAVDTHTFTPGEPSSRPSIQHRINVVILSRLVYRKGIDLAAEVIPVLCNKDPRIHFIIGGDGPKKLLLEETVERHQVSCFSVVATFMCTELAMNLESLHHRVAVQSGSFMTGWNSLGLCLPRMSAQC